MRALSRAAAVLIGVGAALAATEVALAVLDLPRERPTFLQDMFEKDVFVADPSLFWRLSDQSPLYHANRMGTRGPWPAGRKGAHDFRLLCVGDSCTFGVGLRLDETWGHRLRQALAQRLPDHNVDVALAANPGYSTYQDRVLVERTAAELAPDLTVLYCAVWNDYVPAVEVPDAGRRSGWRIVRLLHAALGGPGRDRKEIEALLHSSGALDVRRVSLEELDANVTAMIDCVRRAGSKVLAVLPPLPAKTRREFPIALRYQAALRACLQRHDVPFVDGSARFEEVENGCPDDWLRITPSPCYLDAVHPSAFGDAILAEALSKLADPLLPATRPDAGDRRDDRDAEPLPHLEVRAGDDLVVPAAGARLHEGDPCAWLGARWLPVRAHDRQTLTLDVPLDVPPGDSVLSVAGADGPIALAQVTVAPLPMTASLAPAGDGLGLRAEGRAPPGWEGAVWLASALRPRPAATRYGAFALAAHTDGRPQGRDDLPFVFERLDLPVFAVKVGADGAWHLDVSLPVAAGVTLPDMVWVQGGLRDPDHRWRGSLTRVCELAVPR